MDDGPHPSTLFVFWPGRDMPLAEEVRRAARRHEVKKLEESEYPTGVPWSLAMRVADHPVRIVSWTAERDEVVPTSAFGDTRWWTDERKSARECRWVIAVETLLLPADPLGSLHKQMRWCRAISPESPALYDACTYTLRRGQAFRRLADSNIPPATENLFKIHAVTPEDRDSDAGVWLHTHGLARADLPEIDMVGVPRGLGRAAGEVINDLADLLIGYDVPLSEDNMALGEGRTIGWRPWQEVVKVMPRGVLGGRRDRRGPEDVHAGRRIVIGNYFDRPRRRWKAPIELLRQIHDSPGIHFKSERETQRRSALARERWPEFARRFVGTRPADWRFSVKLGYSATDGVDEVREHLWFSVHGIAGDRILVTLVSRPKWVKHLKMGDSDWHDAALVSDWSIETPHRTFGPDEIDELDEAG